MIEFKEGVMFDDKHDCYVNTINCKGAMGAGVAKIFRDRYPEMYQHYVNLCKNSLLAPGDSWIYKDVCGATLVGLAVKNHWRNRIRYSWAKMAVRNFVNQVRAGQIEAQSIAFPCIGANNGGRGEKFWVFDDSWPDDSFEGYKRLEPFLLAELAKCDKVKFTIYKL